MHVIQEKQRLGDRQLVKQTPRLLQRHQSIKQSRKSGHPTDAEEDQPVGEVNS